ncbi:MAG TPA: DUF5602 domain-containing protein [Chitinophagaceae bacterium]|nr:DUF5602 domain-containing protein [Chitinophagaceae bacterium]
MKRTENLALVMISIGMLVSTAFTCKKDNDHDKGPEGTYYGPVKALGNGTIRSFVVIDTYGKPQTMGLKFTEAALAGLPADTTSEHDTPVELPPQAGTTGFDHIEVDWNPVGHDPKPIFGAPHFDFHFYMISKQEQASVVPGPDTFSVPAKFIPQDYHSGVIAVPDMGVHWVDVTAPEFNGQPFTDTFIYGFYHGKMTFLEPMITRDFLNKHAEYKLTIKQPAAFQKSGYYPTVQHIEYNNGAGEFTLSLEGLSFHNSTAN